MGAALSGINACCTAFLCLGCLSKTGYFTESTAKKLNVIIIGLNVALAMLFCNYAEDWNILTHAPGVKLYDDCEKESATQTDYGFCLKSQIAYRYSFALFIILVLPFIASFIGDDLASGLHRGGFALKLILPTLLALLFILIPNSFFFYFGTVSAVLSCFFLLTQIIAWIDLSYVANTYLVNKWAETNSKWWMTALITSVIAPLAFIATFAGISYSLNSDWEQSAIAWTTSATLIVGVLLTGLGLTDLCPHGSILVSLVVAAYACHTQLLAALSHPSMRTESDKWYVFSSVTSLIITVAVLVWVSSAGSTTPDVFHTDAERDLKRREKAALEALEEQEDEDDANPSTNSSTEPMSPTARRNSKKASPEQTGALRWQYLLFSLLGLYVSMALTGWTTRASPSLFAQGSTVVFWLLSAVAWTIQLLYGWTLIAPAVFPDRDFGA